MRVFILDVSRPRRSLRWRCILFGHDMNNQRAALRLCECGNEILGAGVTRIRHIVSCFISGHTYAFVAVRDGHREYMCTRCGHPLLFPARQMAAGTTFKKKVRYLCNLLGHRVHFVAKRGSRFEYACFCGHTFVKQQRHSKKKITHPLICLFAGHFVEEISNRCGFSEFACKNCGHTFLVGGTNAS